MVKTTKTESVVEEAKIRFEKAKEAYRTSRELAIADTKFAMGDSDNMWQWPDYVKHDRQEHNRVCLTVNITAQHCNQIINEIRRNRPAVKVSPVDDQGDKKTAEILAGLIRNIQTASNADVAHDIAAEHAIYGGEGYWRIITEFESETSFNQVIKIKACPNTSQVYIDPHAKELDKSDANWGFIFEDISIEQAKREYPDIEVSNWVDSAKSSEWYNKDTVRRAEYFYCTYEADTACLLMDGSTALKSALPPFAQIVKERKTQVRKWKWCKLIGGHDKPVDETEWLGAYLPIISVVGKEINIDGEIIRKGQVRDLKDQGRMVNFAYSETVQTLALQNKIPYMAAAEAIEGFEDEWKTANIDNRAYLKFNAYDESGNPLPQPSRQQPAVMPAAQIQLLELSSEQMRAASGQQNANFGIKSEAASGIGIRRLQVQGETATFHFPDNLARALKYEATVLIDLIQKYYDTKRVERILGIDGKEETATLDPDLPGAYHEQDTEYGEIQKIFNPQVGKYDVVVDTGPSYQTQRQEAFANLTELAGRDPNLMAVAGDLIIRSGDFPMADKVADRLAKALPPQLQDEKPGQMQIPPEVQQQMQQMDQQMQQMGMALDEAHGKLQEAEQSNQAIMQKAQIDAQTKMQQAQMDAEINAQKISADMQARREQANMDAQFAIEKARIDADVQMQKAQIEAETKLQIAAMANVSNEQIAEVKAHIEDRKNVINAELDLIGGNNNEQ